jgi:hypothetical protein
MGWAAAIMGYRMGLTGLYRIWTWTDFASFALTPQSRLHSNQKLLQFNWTMTMSAPFQKQQQRAHYIFFLNSGSTNDVLTKKLHRIYVCLIFINHLKRSFFQNRFYTKNISRMGSQDQLFQDNSGSQKNSWPMWDEILCFQSALCA